MSESAIYPYPENWELTTLGELCAEGGGGIQTGPFGSQLHASDYVEVGVPSIMPKNISIEGISTEDIARITEEDAERLSKHRVKPGDIVYSRRGDVEKCSLVTESESGWLCGTGCLKVSFGEAPRVPPGYIHAYLSHPSIREWIVRHAVGATMPNLNTSILSAVPVLVPSEKEVSIVLDVWRNLTKKIILNRQTNQTLEQIAQAIFKSWFVDFEPTRAKIQAKKRWQALNDTTEPSSPTCYSEELDTPNPAQQQPNLTLDQAMTQAAMAAISGKTIEEVAQLSPEQQQQLKTIADLFPDALVESELGEIPEGWEVKSFGDVSSCYDSKRVPLSKKKREEKKPGDIPYYGATSIMDYVNEWIFDGLYLLLGEDGSVIKEDGSPFTQYVWGKTWINNHAHVLKGASGVSTEHLMIFMKNQNIAAYVTGAVQLKLNQKNMNSIPFLFASELLNDQFDAIVQPLFAQFRSSSEQSEKLEKLRDSLLPKLLSGELSLGTEKEELEATE